MGLAHLPDKRRNRSRGDSKPISFARQHPFQTPLFPLEKYHNGFLPAEVRAAIKTMKAATAPGPDHVLADLC
ncbi:unnamed protein product [Strongylus vulgaris]|uniref:Uncharacterized protein n=1 Tax=Strongylus vulgaris TaxID=40348 RepID=A0A3P7KXI3_STRVU|nr:unnamed protein product [Strongylus vulgaris]